MKWFRFYHEFVDDPKIAMMSDSDQLLWVKALCLASDSKERGRILLTDDEICWKLRITKETWSHAVDKFRAKGMIEHCEGGYLITNWEKRQFSSDSSVDRVAAHRARTQKDEQKKQSRNEKRRQQYSEKKEVSSQFRHDDRTVSSQFRHDENQTKALPNTEKKGFSSQSKTPRNESNQEVQQCNVTEVLPVTTLKPPQIQIQITDTDTEKKNLNTSSKNLYIGDSGESRNTKNEPFDFESLGKSIQPSLLDIEPIATEPSTTSKAQSNLVTTKQATRQGKSSAPLQKISEKKKQPSLAECVDRLVAVWNEFKPDSFVAVDVRRTSKDRTRLVKAFLLNTNGIDDACEILRDSLFWACNDSYWVGADPGFSNWMTNDKPINNAEKWRAKGASPRMSQADIKLMDNYKSMAAYFGVEND